MKTTHVITFGFEYGPPPDEADRVYDVRDLEDYPKDPDHLLEARADEIMQELQPGDIIAIGCDYGHDRSTFVARQIEDQYPGVTVDHRDYEKTGQEMQRAIAQRKQQRGSQRERAGNDAQRLQSGSSSRGVLAQGGQGSEEEGPEA